MADTISGRIMWRLPDVRLARFGYVIEYGAAGKMRNCRPFFIEDDGGEGKAGFEGCPTDLVDHFRGLLGYSGRPEPVLVVEDEILRGGKGTFNEPLADRLLLRTVMRVTFDSGGKVATCEVVETRGPVVGETCVPTGIALPNLDKERGEVLLAQSVFLRGEGQN